MSALERKILDTVVSETEQERPPTAGRLVILLEEHFSKPGVYKAVARLKARGMLKLAYPRGPLIPRMTTDGRHCRVGLFTTKPAQEAS